MPKVCAVPKVCAGLGNESATRPLRGVEYSLLSGAPCEYVRPMVAESEMEGALGRVLRRMTHTLDPGEVLAEITSGLIAELDAVLARVWLIGPGDLCARCSMAPICPDHARCLHLAASAGAFDRIDGHYRRIPIGAFKIGEIAATGEPACISDLSKDPRIDDKEWIGRAGIASFAGYALQFRGETLGVLAVFAKQTLDRAGFDRLGLFAAEAAVALKNAQLFDEVSRLSRRLQAENSYFQEEIRAAHPMPIVGRSASIRKAIRDAESVAPTASSVVVLGETGTGKELFARAIHEQSPRRARPLVKVNCAAISPSLIESELFGHEKGAFTGAHQRRAGRFELADGGTLFLDEIGELPLEAQAKLLRVVQERELERVGGAQSVAVDVRLVCATNRDLGAEVRERRFRADLFYRISVFPIHVPPLRERREDIPLLVEACMPALARRVGRDLRGVEDDAMHALGEYDWPGNVRELQNVLERGAIVARGPILVLEDLPEPLATLGQLRVAGAEPEDAKTGVAGAGSLRERVSSYERKLIVEALSKAEGNQVEAARLLRTSRTTLQYKMKVYAL
jgi:transcriptional regulator with GAF, ATPase, and Fis domain